MNAIYVLVSPSFSKSFVKILNTHYLKSLVLLITSESRIRFLNISPLIKFEVIIASNSPLEKLVSQYQPALRVLLIADTKMHELDISMTSITDL